MMWGSLWGVVNNETASYMDGVVWFDYGGTAPADFNAADFDSGDFDT